MKLFQKFHFGVFMFKFISFLWYIVCLFCMFYANFMNENLHNAFIAIKKDQLMVQLLRKKTNSSSNSCSGTQHSKYGIVSNKTWAKAVSKYVLREDLVCRERK